MKSVLKLFLAALAVIVSLPAFASSVGSGGGGDRPERILRPAFAAREPRCQDGDRTYHVEDVTPWGNQKTLQKVEYVCVGGGFFRNGKVPVTNPRCEEGSTKQIVEDVTPWNDTPTYEPVNYVCFRGRFFRENRIPGYVQ